MISKRIKTESVILAGFIVFCPILFVLVFSCSTSPLYKYYIGGDSSFFLLIGREWAAGKVPYRDMFDHKGPFIFLMDAIGWLISGTRYGVIAIQIIFLVVTCYFISKIASLYSQKLHYKILVILVTLTVMTENYVEGNLTEEYCLPFLCASMYFIVKYLCFETNEKHSAKSALLYGITSGICLMTRATNAVYVGIASVVIALVLIKNKYYKNVLGNVIFFFVGMMIVVLPFGLYFWLNGSFLQFIDGTIIKNIEYSKHLSSWTTNAALSDYRLFLRRDFTALCIIPAGFLALRRKKYSAFLFCILSAAMELYILMNGALFAQYALVELPQVAILINEIMYFLEDLSLQRFKRIRVIFLVALLAYSSLVMGKRLKSAIDLMSYCSVYHPVGYEALIDEIPDDEKDDFVSYGYRYFKEPYLLHNMRFCYRFFILQGWHMEQQPTITEELRKDYKQCKAKWILSADYVEGIEDILAENYTLYDSVDGFQLYRLND